MKKKIIFVGDIDSINIEIICKSHSLLKNKVQYYLIGNIYEINSYIKKINYKHLLINEIYDPFSFKEFKKDFLNIFNIENKSKQKYSNLINQIKVSNVISSKTKIDLVTMSIDKSIFKLKKKFIGMTEYLGELNNRKTIMLMHGENFSIIPITTHINPRYVYKSISKYFLKNKISIILRNINKKFYNLNFNKIVFICYNPHCGENDTLGPEDSIIKSVIPKNKKFTKTQSADSAFKTISKKNLFLSMYHDQALIPFKILNKEAINLTLGLEYRRLSPAHGTAKNIKFKNKANANSYIRCMLF